MTGDALWTAAEAVGRREIARLHGMEHPLGVEMAHALEVDVGAGPLEFGLQQGQIEADGVETYYQGA